MNKIDKQFRQRMEVITKDLEGLFKTKEERMLDYLEALFKQDDSWTTKETIFGVVFWIVIGLILIYAWYLFVNWYSDTSDTQFEQFESLVSF